VPQAGAPLTLEKTYLQITDYFGALTWFPWESGLFLKAGAGISTFGITTDSNNTRATGFGLLLGAGFALQLTGGAPPDRERRAGLAVLRRVELDKPQSSQFASVFLGYLYKN